MTEQVYAIRKRELRGKFSEILGNKKRDVR
jgi:hypothetical protein